jgi:peptidoglycan/xylan/chitin deacetylase (PgdA/CDA1 family)
MRLWRFSRRNTVAILTLHGTGAAEDGQAWEPLRPQMDPRRLEQWVRFLSKYYTFVSLDTAVQMLAGKEPLLPNSLVLTFDDGYRNNVTQAWPVLRRLGVPACIFVATGHVERRQPFWFDRLDYVLQHACVDSREFQAGGRTIRMLAGSRGQLRESYRDLREAAKVARRNNREMLQELEGISATLEAETGHKLGDIFETDPWSAVLAWEEIKAAFGDGLIFGSHTVDHVRLAKVDEDMARDQLARSKQMMEAHTNRPCLHLAYPYGSYNGRVAEIARECGYVAGLTTEEGPNRVGAELMTLRRYALPLQASETDLLAHVSGLSAAINRVKKLFLSLLS